LVGAERRQRRPPPVARGCSGGLSVAAAEDIEQQPDGAVVADARRAVGCGAGQAAGARLGKHCEGTGLGKQRAIGKEQVNGAAAAGASLLEKRHRSMQVTISAPIEDD
jgi:hypothetical protein